MFDHVTKLHTLIGKYGLRGFLTKAVRTLCARLCAFLSLPALVHPARFRKKLRKILSGDFDRIVLWRSGFGFQAQLFQRPQQMALALSRQRCLVLYEANPLTDRVRTLRPVREHLLLVNLRSPLLRRMLWQELDRLRKPKYLQIYSTNREVTLRELNAFVRRGWRVLYEYVDALSPAISGTARLPRPVAESFQYAMTHPAVTVVATAERLRQDVIRRRGASNLIAASNGVDYAFFQRWEPYDFEPAFREIMNRGRPIVCYYGALAAWVDYGLLRALAAEGKYSLVLIGVKYDASYDRVMKGAEGVDFLGYRDYHVLKYYAKAADVLILPFLVDEITRATNPVKLYEYMALQKPIVSTDLDECRRCQGILIGHTHEDFLHQIEHALSLRGDETYLALLDAQARANDWSGKAEAVVKGLLEQENRPGA